MPGTQRRRWLVQVIGREREREAAALQLRGRNVKREAIESWCVYLGYRKDKAEALRAAALRSNVTRLRLAFGALRQLVDRLRGDRRAGLAMLAEAVANVSKRALRELAHSFLPCTQSL